MTSLGLACEVTEETNEKEKHGKYTIQKKGNDVHTHKVYLLAEDRASSEIFGRDLIQQLLHITKLQRDLGDLQEAS
jgi:hypothetical protein